MIHQDLLVRRSPPADGCRYGLVQKRELGNVAAVAVNGPAPVAGKHGLLNPNPPSFVGVAQILVLNGPPPNQELSSSVRAFGLAPFHVFPCTGRDSKTAQKGFLSPGSR